MNDIDLYVKRGKLRVIHGFAGMMHRAKLDLVLLKGTASAVPNREQKTRGFSR